jgi:hypothetical protein
MVGIRDSVQGLLHSSFSEARDEVYLVEMPGFVAGGMFGEKVNAASQAVGELKPKNIASFIHMVRHLALSPAVRASRVVGKFGVPYALTRMCTDRLGAQIKWQPSALALSAFKGQAALFAEPFYQVIFAVNPDQAFAWRELFAQLSANTDFKVQRLGEVRPQSLSLQISGGTKETAVVEITTTELKNHYETSWEVLFAGLS